MTAGLQVTETAPAAPEKRAPRPEHLLPLTSLRFFAALIVILRHHPAGLAEHAPTPIKNFIYHSDVGVNLFFLLSGFILAYNYLDRLRDGVIKVRQFWVARFARIYPVYFLSLVLLLPRFLLEPPSDIHEVWSRQHFPQTVLAHLFLVHNWTPSTSVVWNHPTWSIGVEAGFYLLFPLLAIPISRLNGRWLWPAFFGLYALSWVMPYLYHSGWLVQNPIPPFSPVEREASRDMHFVVREWVLPRVPEFVMGMVLARLYARWRSEPEARPKWLAPATLVGLVYTVVLMAATLDPHETFIYVGQVWFTVPFALIILYLALDRGPLSRWMSWAPLVLLGEASYALYVLHIWTKHSLGLAWERAFGISMNTPLFTLFWVIASVGISVIAFRYLETPARRWIVSRFGGKNYGTA